MANHVRSHLRVETNDAGMKVWQEFINKFESEPADVHLAEFFDDAPSDDELTRDWMCDHVGAKWAYADEVEENYMNTTSAWSPVGEFAQYIARKIGEVDEDVIVLMQYEDEFPNFVGVSKYNKDEEIHDEYIEWDEIEALCRKESEELRELWDEENEEWKDDDAVREIFWDTGIQHDVIYEWMEQNS